MPWWWRVCWRYAPLSFPLICPFSSNAIGRIIPLRAHSIRCENGKAIVTASAFQFDKWQNARWESGNRFYSVSIMQDLFGEWTVCCAWGSLFDRRGRHTSTVVGSREEAFALSKKIGQRREKRGYQFVPLSA